MAAVSDPLQAHKTPKPVREDLAARLRLLFDAPDVNTARQLLDGILEECVGKAPQAITCLEAGFDNATPVMGLPDKYRRRLRSTNTLERLNREEFRPRTEN